MGVPRDVTEEIGCSDQRLVFRLALAEVRRLRKTIHSMKVALSTADEDRVAKAIAIADGDVPNPYKWNDSMPGCA